MSQDFSNVSRRGLFQIIGAASATAAFAETTPQQSSTANSGSKPAGKWRVFDAHQQKTVVVLSDLIIPADERSPAASAAGVPLFMDDWIAFRKEQDGHDRLQAEILGGLMWLDRESNRLFNRDFADAQPAQQKQIVD